MNEDIITVASEGDDLMACSNGHQFTVAGWEASIPDGWPCECGAARYGAWVAHPDAENVIVIEGIGAFSLRPSAYGSSDLDFRLLRYRIITNEEVLVREAKEVIGELLRAWDSALRFAAIHSQTGPNPAWVALRQRALAVLEEAK